MSRITVGLGSSISQSARKMRLPSLWTVKVKSSRPRTSPIRSGLRDV
jgi:hypothetical protein